MSTEPRRICPSCGYEYESWVEVCPDCNTPIETQPPKAEVGHGRAQLGKDEDPEWTVVTNVPNAIVGSLIRSQLEDAGIPVLMMRSPSADIGQFTYNDYVPQDIRVPRRLMREARSLVDSPPGGNFIQSDWEEFNEEADDEVLPADERPRTNLPDGWSALPTETDIRARQMLKRSMGAPPEGWYWSDRRRNEQAAEANTPGQQWHNRAAAGPGVRQDDLFAQDEEYYEDYEPYRDSDPYSPRKWIRWVYAILLLVMSLPFILQLLDTLFSTWFNFGWP